jgi:glutathione S-transferase
MATRSTKRQKTEPYELIYWPALPGRGEHIRLAFEEAGVAYTDTAHIKDGVQTVLSQISDSNLGDAHNPPPLAPPILKHGDLIINQTPNILLYLGPKLNLVPDAATDPNGIYYVNMLTLTALDGLSNEPHDTHHPVATGEYYETQKDEAQRKAADYRAVRLPKFLNYFERVLSSPASRGGEFLYGGQLTYADLVLFQTLDGVSHAFPRRVKTLRDGGECDKVWALYERVRGREKIKAYLESERRQSYGMGIYRHYPELDDE